MAYIHYIVFNVAVLIAKQLEIIWKHLLYHIYFALSKTIDIFKCIMY